MNWGYVSGQIYIYIYYTYIYGIYIIYIYIVVLNVAGALGLLHGVA